MISHLNVGTRYYVILKSVFFRVATAMKNNNSIIFHFYTFLTGNSQYLTVVAEQGTQESILQQIPINPSTNIVISVRYNKACMAKPYKGVHLSYYAHYRQVLPSFAFLRENRHFTLFPTQAFYTFLLMMANLCNQNTHLKLRKNYQ